MILLLTSKSLRSARVFIRLKEGIFDDKVVTVVVFKVKGIFRKIINFLAIFFSIRMVLAAASRICYYSSTSFVVAIFLT